MLTIEDIRNDKRKSGFRQVTYIVGSLDQGRRAGRPYRAYAGRGRKGDWKGPRRDTAEEAAQDYCDYVNGLDTQPVQLKRIERPTSTTKAVTEVTDEERELRARLRLLERERQEGRPEYVYLIAEKGSNYGVKVGYSVDPEGRPFGLQTGNPRELVLLGYIEGGKDVEAEIHQKYIGNNLVNEWFIPTQPLFEEFGVDYYAWRKSLQGQIEAPRS